MHRYHRATNIIATAKRCARVGCDGLEFGYTELCFDHALTLIRPRRPRYWVNG